MVFPEFVEWLVARGCTRKTASQRDYDISRFLRLSRRRNPYSATRETLVRYVTVAAKRRGWGTAYRRRIRASFSLFYQWAYRTGRVSQNIADELPVIRTQDPPPHPAPDRVVENAYSRAGLPQKAAICLAASMGLRLSEVAALHPRNRHGRRLTINGKGDKSRLLILNDMTMAVLIRLEETQGVSVYYFPGRSGGHVHPSTVYKWIKPLIGSDWTMHSLRHRAATVALRRTHDIRAVQAFLGHASLRTTQIYTKVTEDDLQSVALATEWLPALPTQHIPARNTLGRTILIDLDHATLEEAQTVFEAAMHAQGVDTDRASERA